MENNYNSKNQTIAREGLGEQQVTDSTMDYEAIGKKVENRGNSEAKKDEIVTRNKNNLTFEDEKEKLKGLLPEEYAKKLDRYLPTIRINSEFPGGQINSAKDLMDAIDEQEYDEDVKSKLNEEVPETKVDLTDGLMKIYNWDDDKAGIYAGITVESKSKRSKLCLILKHEDGVCCDPFEFRISDFSSNKLEGSKVLKELTDFQGNNHIDCNKLYHDIWTAMKDLPRVTYETYDTKPNIGVMYRKLILEAKRLYSKGITHTIKKGFYFFLDEQFDEVAKQNRYMREELLRQLALAGLLMRDKDGRLAKSARVNGKFERGYAVIDLDQYLMRKPNKPIIDKEFIQELEDSYLATIHDANKKLKGMLHTDDYIGVIAALSRHKERIKKAKEMMEENSVNGDVDDKNVIDGTYREIQSDTDNDSSEEGIKVTEVTSESSSLEIDNVTADINNNQP